MQSRWYSVPLDLGVRRIGGKKVAIHYGSIVAGGLATVALVGLAVQAIKDESAKPDEHKITIVYDVKEGIGLQLDKGVQAQKVPCYPGDPVGRCFLISCKPPEVEESVPESSDE
jgi:hypothetical protein